MIHQSPCVISNHPRLANNKMCSLIKSTELRSWDLDVLNDLFNATYIVFIMSIPLSEFQDEDHWYWSNGRSRCYTVRSAYEC